jgi:hypothetical protein
MEFSLFIFVSLLLLRPLLAFKVLNESLEEDFEIQGLRPEDQVNLEELPLIDFWNESSKEESLATTMASSIFVNLTIFDAFTESTTENVTAIPVSVNTTVTSPAKNEESTKNTVFEPNHTTNSTVRTAMISSTSDISTIATAEASTRLGTTKSTSFSSSTLLSSESPTTSASVNPRKIWHYESGLIPDLEMEEYPNIGEANLERDRKKGRFDDSGDTVSNDTTMSPSVMTSSTISKDSTTTQTSPPTRTVKPCESYHCEKLSQYLETAMNRSADPCDDFREFTCGNWKDQFDIPAYLPSWGNVEKEQLHLYFAASQIMHDKSLLEKRYWDLLTTAKIAYDACMDEDSIEKLGYETFKEEVEERMTGYPLGEHYWRKSNFKPNEMIAKVIQLLGKSALLNIQFVETAENLADEIHIKFGYQVIIFFSFALLCFTVLQSQCKTF